MLNEMKSACGGLKQSGNPENSGMNKILLILLTIIPILSGLTIEAQSQFQQTIGGTNLDYAYSIVQTTDGGYAAAGYTSSFGAGSDDFYIVKLNGIGTLQWNRTVGGTNFDDAYSITQTTDGGYALAGVTGSFGAGYNDFYIVKLDGSGMLQWNKTVGGTYSDYANSITQTTDGGYVMAGYTASFGAGSSDSYIIKLDSSGTIQWTKSVGGTNDDEAYSIIQTTDGGYAVAGGTASFGAGYNDFYIVKLDAGGTLQWSRTFGGAGYDYAYSIIQTTDGGYAVAGGTGSFGAGAGDFYIVKLDSSGTLQWSKTVGGTGNEYGYSIIQTTDGGYAVAGNTSSFGAVVIDFYVVKLDGTGTLQWSRTVGGTGLDVANSVIQTTDGGYVVAGYTGSFGAGYQMYIVKFDAGGNACGNSSSPSSISGTGGTMTSPTSTTTSPPSTVTTPPSSTTTGGTVTNICTMVGVVGQQNEMPEKFFLSQNYPNPFNPTTKIKFALPGNVFAKLVVYDALGREVETIVNEQLNAGIYEVDWNAEKSSSGIYYYKITARKDSESSTGDFTETKKMILIK